MSQRRGSSCELKKPHGKVTETRRFIGSTSGWEVVCKQAIRDKQYLILTICINRNDGSGNNNISDNGWKDFVSTSCTKLKSFGGTSANSRISLINEPMKFISKERYGQLVKISYPIVKANGFKMGAGNEQFTMAMVNGDMYTYILENHRNSFDILDIHLQGDCELDELCREKADWFKFMADLYDKPIDCTEAFYGDIATDRGYGTLKNQAYHAERIGCPNFCSVFYDLWESAFPASMQKFLKGWYKLCFKINGIFRNSTTEKYWGNWFEIINSKAPVPNIKPIIIEDSDMKLVNLKKGSINGQTWWLQEILMLEYGYPNNYDPPFDGKFGGATKEQVKEYQRANGLDDDGVVGIKTTLDLLFDVDKKPIEDRKESTDYWLKRLTVLTAFPDSYFNK